MRVCETFSSLQGEGILAGTPSFFIRTAGCNLRCRWCDTPQAVLNPHSVSWSVSALTAAAASSGLRHVVVTGGEPLLQREVGPLTSALAHEGLHVTVETVGTVAPEFHCDLLSLSPKTANSDPDGSWRARHRRRRADLRPARALLERFHDHQLKLVIERASDMGDVYGLLRHLPMVSPHRVLLMPQGRTAEEVRAKAPTVAALCLEHGFGYTPRLQLDFPQMEPAGDRARGRGSPG